MNYQLFLAKSPPFSHMALYRFMVAAIILVALTAEPQQAALADSRQYDELPKELNLRWWGEAYDQSVSSVELEWDGQRLNYKVTRPPSVKAVDSDHRSIKPSKRSWKEFGWL